MLNNETLSTLPATRGYGSALAAVPALNIGGVAGAGATHGADHAADDVLHRARRRQRRRAGDDQRPDGRGAVRRRRRVGRHLRHRQRGGDAGADFRRPRRSRDRRAEHQHRAEVGRQRVPRRRRSTARRATGRRRTTSTTSCAASASRSRRRCAPTGTRAAASAVRSSAIACGSSPTCAAGPTPRSSTASSRTASPATRRTGTTRPITSIEARTAEARKIYAGRLTAQITPRNRVTFSHDYQRRCGGSTLRADGDGCRQAGGDWVASGRTFGADTVSPETFPGYHDFPYNTTQATYSAPLSSRTLIEARLLAIRLRLRAVRHGGAGRVDGPHPGDRSRPASTGGRTSRIAACSIRSTSASTTTTR